MFIKTWFIAILLTVISACSSDPEEAVVEQFSVSLSESNFTIEPDTTREIQYTLDLDGQFDISISIESQPEIGQLTLDIANNQIQFSASEEGLGSFTILFSSSSLQVSKEVVFEVATPFVEPPIEEPPVVEPPITNDQDFIIYLPSDYITIFEEESITLDIKRNYEINEQIEEAFYFNSDNISGLLSQDKSQITITAENSEEDTYGELTAVTTVNGIVHETKMYIIYYNKNRDLTTTEPPVIALIEHEIPIKPYSTQVKFFDIYDPDSDRISYRILSSPAFVETHIDKVSGGYELTIYTLGEIDESDNDIVLEVSDAHNKDVHTFNLVEDTSQVANPENHRPKISIEENVTVSLIRQFDGTETGQIAELAFAVDDIDGDPITLSATASGGNYEFNFVEPYLYIKSEDLSDLEYDQITIVASDGQFDSKMTFHFYIKDNFLEFLGGNPNIAPMSDLPTELNLLETKTYEIPFYSSDHEGHPFDVGLESDSAFAETTLTDRALILTASAPEITTSSSITIWLEDVFESRREHTITLNIYKNTPPSINVDIVEIFEPEQTITQVQVSVDDVDQPDLQPQFEFDEEFVTLSYENGVATISSVDLEEDYLGQVRVFTIDEFDMMAEQIIELDYQFLDPNNQFPVITIAEEEFELLPGEDGSTTVSIVDPESDPLVITSSKSSDEITYEYDMNTGDISFSVSEDAAFEQEFEITISASDGFGLSQKNITITVPRSPAAPVLTVDFYEEDVPERIPFVINFTASDINNEAIEMSVSAVSSWLTVELFSEEVNGQVEGYLKITPPENVFNSTPFRFELVATDASALMVSQAIVFNVQPVNDPPQIEYIDLDDEPGVVGEPVVLQNDIPVTLIYAIEDPDTIGQQVRVLFDPLRPNDNSYNYDVIDWVQTGSNSIRINGSSKDDIFGLISSTKPGDATAVNGDTIDLTLTVLVQEEADDGNLHGDEMDVDFTAEFVNNKPDIGSFDLIQLYENRTKVLNLNITDGDNEEVCVTINNSSDFLEIWDIRAELPSPVKLALNTPICGLSQIRIDALPVGGDESEFITINATDGYEPSSKQILIDVLNL